MTGPLKLWLDRLLVAVLEDLHKAYGKRLIYDGFSLTIRRGERPHYRRKRHGERIICRSDSCPQSTGFPAIYRRGLQHLFPRSSGK